EPGLPQAIAEKFPAAQKCALFADGCEVLDQLPLPAVQPAVEARQESPGLPDVEIDVFPGTILGVKSPCATHHVAGSPALGPGYIAAMLAVFDQWLPDANDMAKCRGDQGVPVVVHNCLARNWSAQPQQRTIEHDRAAGNAVLNKEV